METRAMVEEEPLCPIRGSSQSQLWLSSQGLGGPARWGRDEGTSDEAGERVEGANEQALILCPGDPCS